LDIESKEHRFVANEASGEVSSLLTRPSRALALYVFAHGAGAGMRHAFMAAVSERLARRGVATFRYQFPYMEAGRGGPNPAPVLVGTVRSAIAEAERLLPGLPLVAGGKSMGGRMTSVAAAQGGLPRVRGLGFFGFPLHPAGRPATSRGTHLADVRLPMLFLQGSRDKLADLALLEPLTSRLLPRPRLHVVEGADHGFHVTKSSGRSDEGVLDELCDVFRTWVEDVLV
jgi:predicted alpha/beta-hydrolase family hydrolase